jgi:hypothetical protein
VPFVRRPGACRAAPGARGAALAALAALVALVASPAPARAAEPGLNIAGGAASGTQETYDQLTDTGARWARHFLHYDDIDGAGLRAYDEIIRQEGARGIKTLLVVVSARRQPPLFPQLYADFIGMIARRWKGQLEAVEIWNEPDEPEFWAGGPDPARYVDLLQRSYRAAKEADPQLKVVFGPTTGNNYAFLEEAYRAGAKGHFDVMAAHTDTACLVDAPSSYYRDGGRIARFTFLGYRELRATMLAHGDDKPIWLTEIGWSAATHPCDRGRWAGQKPAGVGERLQADHLREAFHCLKEDPYVEVAMWFNNRDPVADGRELTSYGLLRADGSRRPAYAAFQDVARGVDRVTGPCGDFRAPTITIHAPTRDAIIGTGQPLRIRVSSPDRDVHRITLALEGGAKIRSFTNGNRPLAPSKAVGLDWMGAKRLGVGTHTLVVTAVDAQGNEGTARVTFRKVDPATLPAQRTRFAALRLRGTGRTRTLVGRVTSPLPFAPGGKVLVEWQNHRKGRWRKIHGGAANANRPFRFTQRLRYRGRWRVRVRYGGQRPFRRAVSGWVTFRVR